MNKNKIDIRTGTLFPWHFQFLAVIVLIIAAAIIVERTIIAAILMAGSVFILSGYSGLQIDRERRIYKEYMSFFLLKRGKEIKYTGIEKIFINSSKVSQQMYSARTTQSSTFTNSEFNGYLKFDDGTKIHLNSQRNKEKLMKVLNKVAEFLNVPIEDNTVMNK